MLMPWVTRKIPMIILNSRNRKAMSELNFEKNPHSSETAPKLLLMLKFIKTMKYNPNRIM